MTRILILVNNDVGLYCFRKESIQHFVMNHNVQISLPDGDRVPEINTIGANSIFTPMDQRETNSNKDLYQLIR